MKFCEVGENLAIKIYLVLLERADHFGIRHAQLTRAGVDFDIPELAVVRFLISAVREGISSRMQ